MWYPGLRKEVGLKPRRVACPSPEHLEHLSCPAELGFPLQYMEKLSHLAFHPVKMQSCYEKMEQLKLEGLQQRFDVSSTSVFKQRAQIHMRQVGWGPRFSCVLPRLRAEG